jgi:beta-N-acetylhexosaminidase
VSTRKLIARLGLVLVVALLSVFVLLGRPPATQPVAVVTSPSPFPASPLPSDRPTAEPWNLDADVGAVMILSWTATTPWSAVQAELVRDEVGSVLLFTPNFGGLPSGMRALDTRLQAVASTECLDHPILTMLDEEGGEVANVKATWAPPWPEVMASSGAAQVRAYEKTSGAGLRAAGVGLNLAPVADVRTNPGDLVIGARSFGSSPSTVAPLVGAAVQGLHDGGVGATLKHFPGLGGAAGDPHVAIPTDKETEAQWEAVQLPSFKAGVSAGADAVMVTAVYTPGLGSGSLPAMFSSAVVSRIRTQLGFQGVIVTDSLSMGGIGARWSLPQAAVMALAAGNDFVMLGNGSVSYEAQAIAAVKAAVRSGRLSWAAIHASALRVNALRDKWGGRLSPCRQPI